MRCSFQPLFPIVQQLCRPWIFSFAHKLLDLVSLNRLTIRISRNLKRISNYLLHNFVAMWTHTFNPKRRLFLVTFMLTNEYERQFVHLFLRLKKNADYFGWEVRDSLKAWNHRSIAKKIAWLCNFIFYLGYLQSNARLYSSFLLNIMNAGNGNIVNAWNDDKMFHPNTYLWCVVTTLIAFSSW